MHLCCSSSKQCSPHSPARSNLGSSCLAPHGLHPAVLMPQPVGARMTPVPLPAPARLAEVARHLQVVGEDACPGIKQGGFPSVLRKKLPIFARGDSIPGHIEVDITGLKIGQRITLPQMQPLAGVEIASQVRHACRTACALLLDATALPVCCKHGFCVLPVGTVAWSQQHCLMAFNNGVCICPAQLRYVFLVCHTMTDAVHCCCAG